MCEKQKNISASLHCWQGDDVKGFDTDGPLTGGIQTTGNYMGRARTSDELMADMDKVMSLCPGKIGYALQMITINYRLGVVIYENY